MVSFGIGKKIEFEEKEIWERVSTGGRKFISPYPSQPPLNMDRRTMVAHSTTLIRALLS
jgi:hypothetical protein